MNIKASQKNTATCESWGNGKNVEALWGLFYTFIFLDAYFYNKPAV